MESNEQVPVPVAEVELDAYDSTISSLQGKFTAFVTEAQSGKGKKASALRARKLSLELRKDLQEFRSASVTNDKAH